MLLAPVEGHALLGAKLRSIPFVWVREIEVLVVVVHDQGVVVVYPLAGVGFWVP